MAAGLEPRTAVRPGRAAPAALLPLARSSVQRRTGGCLQALTSCAAVAARESATRNEPKEMSMATRFIHKALATASLLGLTLSLAATPSQGVTTTILSGPVELESFRAMSHTPE